MMEVHYESDNESDRRNQEYFLLVDDISQKFNKTAGGQDQEEFCEGIQSKIHELHDDLYVSFDVQAYSCKPEETQAENPLQYVVSLNPPMMLTNYCMAPLEVYEIENPRKPKFKDPVQIAPAMSGYLFEIDLSIDNKLDVLYQFYDTSLNEFMSYKFQKFNVPKETSENEASTANDS